MLPKMVVWEKVSLVMDIWALRCSVVEMLTRELSWNTWRKYSDVIKEIRKGAFML
ncbi:hypothetical protein LINPERHAP1_LOCUS42834 [Linum perenne]